MPLAHVKGGSVRTITASLFKSLSAISLPKFIAKKVSNLGDKINLIAKNGDIKA